MDGDSDEAGIMAIPQLIPYFILDIYLKIFDKLYNRISKIREERADKIATYTCGNESFGNALKKTISTGIVFSNSSFQHITTTLREGKMFDNYFEIFRNLQNELSNQIIEQKEIALSKKDSKSDSHPSLSKRLEYLPKTEEKYNDHDKANKLITNITEHEILLTEQYTNYINYIYSIH